jgi:hypothetical protein
MRLQEVEAPRIFRLSAHKSTKGISPMQRPPLPSRRYSWYSILLEAKPTRDHSAAGRMKSMKNVTDSTVNRTRDLPLTRFAESKIRHSSASFLSEFH